MKGISTELYPIQIQEARYSGACEGGEWIMICGLEGFEHRTDAVASDGLCMDFWQRVKRDGPIIDVIDPEGGVGDMTQIYAAAGDHPGELYDEFLHFINEHDEFQSPEWTHTWSEITDTQTE